MDFLLQSLLLPGLVSGHDHLLASNWTAYGVSLFGSANKEEYFQRIKEYAAANPDESVILGIGWNLEDYGAAPTAAELDKIVSDRPAILLDLTIHDAWLNSKAMKIGGIDRNTPDPVPNVTYWRRDKEGNPTGTGVEFAWMPTYVAVGAWRPDTMIPASIKTNFAKATAAGITAFLNPALVTPNVSDSEGMFADYQAMFDILMEMKARGALDMRAFLQPGYKSPKAKPEWFAERAADFSKRYDNDMLRSFGIKIHPEGNWSSHTSLMLEPYSDDPTTVGAANVMPPF